MSDRFQELLGYYAQIVVCRKLQRPGNIMELLGEMDAAREIHRIRMEATA